jgi:hypothetical protein
MTLFKGRQTVFVLIIGALLANQIALGASLIAKNLSDDDVKNILILGAKPLSEQILEIKSKINLELIFSHRKVEQKYFESLGPARRSIDEITDIEGLYGKAVCPQNSEKAKILLADDAPPTTLLHEYIHVLQIQKIPRWCELSGKVLSKEEKQERAFLYHSFEFEVLKILWDLRDKIPMNTEDHLILIEGLDRENKVFLSQGIKALDEATAKQVATEAEDVRVRLDFYTWLTKSRNDASTVLEKLEVISLKSCAEKTEGKTEAEKINRCLKRRLEYSHSPFHQVSESELNKLNTDLISKLIYAWTQPQKSQECPLSRMRDEFINGLEQSTTCWLKWFESKKRNHLSLSLKPVKIKEVEKRFGIPGLGIDQKILFYESSNPESLINRSYCYFVFQKVVKFDSLPIDQFPFSMMGASLSTSLFADYKVWLKDDEKGKLCSRLVKLFTGQLPEIVSFPKSKKTKYVLIFNPIAALTGGLEQLKDNLGIDINHERLHALYADNAVIRSKIKTEWNSLSNEERETFKKQHSSYDFTKEEVLLKEYFSYTRQTKPQRLF